MDVVQRVSGIAFAGCIQKHYNYKAIWQHWRQCCHAAAACGKLALILRTIIVIKYITIQSPVWLRRWGNSYIRIRIPYPSSSWSAAAARAHTHLKAIHKNVKLNVRKGLMMPSPKRPESRCVVPAAMWESLLRLLRLLLSLLCFHCCCRICCIRACASICLCATVCASLSTHSCSLDCTLYTNSHLLITITFICITSSVMFIRLSTIRVDALSVIQLGDAFG